MLNYRELSLNEFGLDDPEVLEVATQVAPELFAALVISHRLAPRAFPLTTDSELEDALRQATSEPQGIFEAPGVTIKPDDVRDRFPAGFLPVEDRFDLIRKVYMAIVISHTTEARERLMAARRGELTIESTHPFNLEDI